MVPHSAYTQLSSSALGFDFFLRALFVFAERFAFSARCPRGALLSFEQQVHLREFGLCAVVLLFARQWVFLALRFGAWLGLRGPMP